ncbi:hypothetical protein OQJ18_02005 [Fluoribacter dumoffii]|nr:hypothetical protein [Fluoribacter dumoffii]MCW8386087.1 hypothetical protein [Fluoribacter dumoffii]MCW8419139.1 hypothetical protein [Fluoribacter dumoffii]MCW8453017.1 hypothetical protein [Fluoribacter dumoffii]MCW8459765.1 hypothetical protein [Fluoribacter dumoffii]MCW8483122.1 hypothetical protein [Fluoribacter dumoffii]
MMSSKWIKSHLTLIAGLSLPLLLILVFVIANLPFFKTDPPRYNLLFSILDSSSSPFPVQVNFFVKNGRLVAQYSKNQNNYWGIKKLYLFDAKTQKVRELPLDFSVLNNNANFKEEVVQATKQFKLDTSLESPDGYTLYTDNDNLNTGLLSDLFLGSNYRNNSICLKKNSTCIKLPNLGTGRYFNASNVQFIGWVKP